MMVSLDVFFGKSSWCYCCTVGNNAAFQAEMEAMLFGVEISKCEGLDKIWIELNYALIFGHCAIACGEFLPPNSLSRLTCVALFILHTLGAKILLFGLNLEPTTTYCKF